MNSFEYNSTIYKLRERRYHRELEGGYEKWTFETEGKLYYVDGDIRYLPDANDKVLYVDFYSQASLDSGAQYTLTNEEGYSALHIINCIVELVVKRLPKFRYYRYLVFPCPKEWHSVITTLISKYGELVNDSALTKEIEKNYNYDLTVLVDSGYYTSYVGKLLN